MKMIIYGVHGKHPILEMCSFNGGEGFNQDIEAISFEILF